MSASSVALNVPLFCNSEPGLAPPLELMFRVPPLKLATPLLTRVRPVLLPLPKVFEPVPLIVSVAVLSTVVVPVLASAPPVQLKARGDILRAGAAQRAAGHVERGERGGRAC